MMESAERSRDDPPEEVGAGARAEVTPAPRWSRGRAPVRFDAFLSHPISPSLCLRYVIFPLSFLWYLLIIIDRFILYKGYINFACTRDGNRRLVDI